MRKAGAVPADVQVQITRRQSEVRGDVTQRRGAKDQVDANNLTADLMAAIQASGGTLTVQSGGQTVTVQAPAPVAQAPQVNGAQIEDLKRLDENFRLYKKEGKGLTLITGGEALERLTQGKPVEIVTRAPGTTETVSARSASADNQYNGVLGGYDREGGSSSSREASVKVNFSSSTITSLATLGTGLINTDGGGLGGVPKLKSSEGSVTVSYDYEARRRTVDVHQWGVFNVHTSAAHTESYDAVRARNGGISGFEE